MRTADVTFPTRAGLPRVGASSAAAATLVAVGRPSAATAPKGRRFTLDVLHGRPVTVDTVVTSASIWPRS
jgi:hypothetical protein